jgi:hypothetical protein
VGYICGNWLLECLCGFGQAFNEAKRAYFRLISNEEVNQIVLDTKGLPLVKVMSYSSKSHVNLRPILVTFEL